MTSNSKPEVIVVNFDDDDKFGVLYAKDYVPGYNKIGLEDLSDEDFQDDEALFLTCLTCLADGKDLDLKDVISVKATESGMVDRIYTPAMFASEGGEGLVIRAGSNLFPVTQNGRTFTCGEMQGEIESYSVKYGDKEYKVPRIDFVAPKGGLIFSLRVFGKDETVNGDSLKHRARAGGAIAGYLREAKGGNYQVVKPTELPEGEYLVTGIDQKEHPEYGTGYFVALDGGKALYANFGMKKQLKSSFNSFSNCLKGGRPVTLIIANIREGNNKKMTCDAVFRNRAPHTSNMFKQGFVAKELPGAAVDSTETSRPKEKGMKSAEPDKTEGGQYDPLPF